MDDSNSRVRHNHRAGRGPGVSSTRRCLRDYSVPIQTWKANSHVQTKSHYQVCAPAFHCRHLGWHPDRSGPQLRHCGPSASRPGSRQHICADCRATQPDPWRGDRGQSGHVSGSSSDRLVVGCHDGRYRHPVAAEGCWMIRDQGPLRLSRRHAGIQPLPDAVPPAGAHDRISHTSSARPNKGDDTWLQHLSQPNGQGRSWPPNICAIGSSRTALKSASGHRTTAMTCKVTIPAKLRTPERRPGFGKSATQTSVWCEILIKDRVPMWIFLPFTGLVPRQLRIPCFKMTGRMPSIRSTTIRSSFERGRGLVHIRKNLGAGQCRQSLAAVPDEAFAHLKFWRDQGLSARAATAVAAAGCQSLDDIRNLGWHSFEGRDNCGRGTLQQLSNLVGGWPDEPRKYSKWVRRASDDVLIQEMRRRGIAVGSDEAR